MIIKGIITKALSGFYYVKSAETVYECKAPGIFRKQNVTPFVGDIVKAETENGKGVLTEILPRKNSFARPPLANIDQIFYIVSTCQPEPNYNVLDQLLVVAEYKGINSIIVVTKTDMSESDEIERIYSRVGYQTILIDNNNWKTDNVSALFKGKTSALCGNSGVGKSTLLNNIEPGLNLETGETSTKLGRGRHTTRHVELFAINDGLVSDTPGFSTVDILRYDKIAAEDIAMCFKEFDRYENKCKFTGCSHTVEKGCVILEALKNGQIEPSRHKSYVQMYQNAKSLNDWE